MEIHWFDSFDPSDWVATGSAGISLFAIAVPTGLFFLERRDRKKADADAVLSETARQRAEEERAEAQQKASQALIDLQQKDLDRQEQLAAEAAEREERAQAELVHIWADGTGLESRLHILNTSRMPVVAIMISVIVTWYPEADGEIQWTEPMLMDFMHGVSQLGPTGETPVKLGLMETDWRLLSTAPEDHHYGGMDVERLWFQDANGVTWTRSPKSDNRLRKVVFQDAPEPPGVS